VNKSILVESMRRRLSLLFPLCVTLRKNERVSKEILECTAKGTRLVEKMVLGDEHILNDSWI
jgi:hypothetical protein